MLDSRTDAPTVRPAAAGALAVIGRARVRRPVRSRATRQPSDILLAAPRSQIIEAVVPPHATLDGLLRAHDLPAGLIQAAVRSAASVFNLRQLRENQPYRLVRSLDGLLEEFEYQIDADRFLRIVTPDRSAAGGAGRGGAGLREGHGR